jgi:hypothetical protein
LSAVEFERGGDYYFAEKKVNYHSSVLCPGKIRVPADGIKT